MPYVASYRTESGRLYFRWSFQQFSNGEVRAYIISWPSYCGRREDGHSTHRYYDQGIDRYYICYDPMPFNLDDAIKIAIGWAERTEAYIFYGQRF